ncbi:hypothetical protein D0817_06795 [Flavobacterium cupreum]|uniref:Uncharacterized protein n=1 Tax=Flavobacterium cupreum TaxID=2133766 RepID=A0A434AB03_9FLAO|nr:hypothetical protein [Flavobacterium cupreum]RUT71573.1 hypothetical protein D0817_06795 [Flavobacterium cupreum]
MVQQDADNFEFAEYLYNEFVENHRKHGKDARLYWYVLGSYIKLGLSKENQTEERQYAQKLSNIIGEAVRDWNTHLLLLKGEHGEQEYKQRMEQFIKRLWALGHDEQSIIELIIKKLKLNYGNDN